MSKHLMMKYLFGQMLNSFHQLELVRQPEGGGESEEGAALVERRQRNRNVEEKSRDSKSNLIKEETISKLVERSFVLSILTDSILHKMPILDFVFNLTLLFATKQYLTGPQSISLSV